MSTFSRKFRRFFHSLYMSSLGKLKQKLPRPLRTKHILFFLLIFLTFLFLLHPSQTQAPILEISQDPNESITFVVVPYPIKTEKLSNLYQLTYGSYLLTDPKTKILVLMPRHEFDPKRMFLPIMESHYGKGRFLFAPPIEADEDGVPYIDSWITEGFDYSESSLICFINSDIIIPEGWLDRIKFLHQIRRHKGRQTTVISRRCDFNFDLERKGAVQYPIDFKEITRESTLHHHYGVDFYLFSRDFYDADIDDVPPFHMGRYRWDPWMTGFLNEKTNLVTLESFCTYHVNHPPKSRDSRDPKVKENHEIASIYGRYSASNIDAKYELRSIGEVRNWSLVKRKNAKFYA